MIYEIFLGGKVKVCEYFIKQKQQQSIIIQFSKRIFINLICLIKIFMQKKIINGSYIINEMLCSGEIICCIGWVIYQFKFEPSIISNLTIHMPFYSVTKLGMLSTV